MFMPVAPSFQLIMHRQALIVICLTCLTALLSAQAEAWSKKAKWFFRPHIGALYQYTSVDPGRGDAVTENNTIEEDFLNYDNFMEDAYHAYNIYFGVRIHKRIGFEISYFKTGEETVEDVTQLGDTSTINTPTTVDSELSGLNYDIMYFYRFHKNWEWMLSFGFADWDIKLNTTLMPQAGTRAQETVVLGDDDDTFLRYGFGVQYDVSKRLKIRAVAHYLDTDFNGVDVPWTAGIGAHIAF